MIPTVHKADFPSTNMSDDRANIKVSREFYEEHSRKRTNLGLTWEEYIEAESLDIEEQIREILREELDKREE